MTTKEGEWEQKKGEGRKGNGGGENKRRIHDQTFQEKRAACQNAESLGTEWNSPLDFPHIT